MVLFHSLKKWGNLSLVKIDNMSEPGRHDAEWNKPDIEKQILQDLSCMGNLKMSNT